MGGEDNWFSTLPGFLDEAIGQFPDKRTGKNTRYSMRDVALLSVLGILYPKPLLSLPSEIDAPAQRQQQRRNHFFHPRDSYRQSDPFTA